MDKLTSSEQRALDAIRQHIAQHHIAPTLRELAALCGWRSWSTASRVVEALVRKGWVAKRKGASRAIWLV